VEHLILLALQTENKAVLNMAQRDQKLENKLRFCSFSDEIRKASP
jgi:hypothetical protein